MQNYLKSMYNRLINILRICDKHILTEDDCNDEKNDDNTNIIKNKYRILYSKLNA